MEEESKLFAYDGKNIHLYCYNKDGNLRLADEQFNEVSNCHKKLHQCYAEEHANVGDIAFQTFFESLHAKDQEKLKKNLEHYGLAHFRKTNSGNDNSLYVDLKVGEQKIRAGMLVSFGGYYSIPDEPIAYDVSAPIDSTLTPDQLEKRFLAAFKTLAFETTGEAHKIGQQIGHEGHTIHGLIKRKARPSIVMGAVKDGQITWAHYTSRSLGWQKHIPGGFFIGQYVQSATMNFDHFGKEAEMAYETGHRLALQIADIASYLDEKSKWKKFTEALSIELFACHFFADLFVSGHVRTPRRLVFETLNEGNNVKKKWIAALFANLMHDEDNERGVYVCSKNHVEPWEAMGDYRYYDDHSSDEGEKIVHKAIAARLMELYQVFCGQTSWQEIATQFKKDIPKEVTLASLQHGNSGNESANSCATAHLKKNPPYLIEKDNTLQVRPYYQVIQKKEIILLLAEVLSKGIQGEIKDIHGQTTQEIARITPIVIQNGKEENEIPLSEYLALATNPLQQRIIEELYLMDTADEIIVAIESPIEISDV